MTCFPPWTVPYNAAVTQLQRLKPSDASNVDARMQKLDEEARYLRSTRGPYYEAGAERANYIHKTSKFRPEKVPADEQPFPVGTNGLGQMDAQRYLARRGYLTPSDVDGSWGPNSCAAWRQYQVDKLSDPVRYARNTTPFNGLDSVDYQIGDKGAGPRAAIEALAKKGLYRGKVNAYWGPQAAAALAEYKELEKINKCKGKENPTTRLVTAEQNSSEAAPGRNDA